MEQEGTRQVEQRSGSPDNRDARPDLHNEDAEYDLMVRQVNKSAAVYSSSNPNGLAESAVPIIRDLLDLPRQVLPEQTYRHLKNAGKEAILAIVSLLNSLDLSAKDSNSGRQAIEHKDGPRNKHIDANTAYAPTNDK